MRAQPAATSRTHIRWHACVGAILALSGTAVTQGPEPSPPAQTRTAAPAFHAAGGEPVAFECEGGVDLVAEFEDDRVRLRLPDGAITLPRVRSASGAKYSDGESTFWTKGDEALLTLPERERLRCVEAGGASTEAASMSMDAERRQDVDFRAIGNEPPWILQIQSDERIVLATGYEQTQHVFPATEPVVDEAAGRRTYRTSADGRTLTVVIDEQPCRDTMSGEAFPATVVVRFDGETYRGCGRPVG